MFFTVALLPHENVRGEDWGVITMSAVGAKGRFSTIIVILNLHWILSRRCGRLSFRLRRGFARESFREMLHGPLGHGGKNEIAGYRSRMDRS